MPTWVVKPTSPRPSPPPPRRRRRGTTREDGRRKVHPAGASRPDKTVPSVDTSPVSDSRPRSPPRPAPAATAEGVLSILHHSLAGTSIGAGEAAYIDLGRTVRRTAPPRGQQRSFPPAHLCRPPSARDGEAFTDRLHENVVASASQHRLRAKGSPTIDPARNPASARVRTRAETQHKHTHAHQAAHSGPTSLRSTASCVGDRQAAQTAPKYIPSRRTPHNAVYGRSPLNQVVSPTFVVGRLRDTVREWRMHLERQRTFGTSRTRKHPVRGATAADNPMRNHPAVKYRRWRHPAQTRNFSYILSYLELQETSTIHTATNHQSE